MNHDGLCPEEPRHIEYPREGGAYLSLYRYVPPFQIGVCNVVKIYQSRSYINDKILLSGG